MSLGLYELRVMVKEKVFGIQPEKNDVRLRIYHYTKEIRELERLATRFVAVDCDVYQDEMGIHGDEMIDFLLYPLAQGVTLFRSHQQRLRDRISWLERYLQ